jgi:hypothetical protein
MAILENRDEWEQIFRSGWLAHLEASGETNFKIYNRARNREDIGGPGVDLRRSRLLFISTAGAYLAHSQEAFDQDNDLGDYSIRRFPSDVALGTLDFAHTHYDHRYVDADAQVLLPLQHLADLVREGVVGSLTGDMISYMGYQPDMTRIVDELVPAVVAAAQQMNADAALLVPA